MILLFGQHPTGATADRQYPMHARVGSVGDVVPPPPIPEPPQSGGGGGGGWRSPVYIRRQEIIPNRPEIEEDLLLALTAFILLETNAHE